MFALSCHVDRQKWITAPYPLCPTGPIAKWSFTLPSTSPLSQYRMCEQGGCFACGAFGIAGFGVEYIHLQLLPGDMLALPGGLYSLAR